MLKIAIRDFQATVPVTPQQILKNSPVPKASADNGARQPMLDPCVYGAIEPLNNGELEKDITNLKTAMAANGVKRGFMNAASPGVISLFLQNDYYPSRLHYLEALSEVMKSEYKAIMIWPGLQLDCPDLALSRHMLFAEMSDDEFIAVADHHVAALNHALEGLPKEKSECISVGVIMKDPIFVIFLGIRCSLHDENACWICAV